MIIPLNNKKFVVHFSYDETPDGKVTRCSIKDKETDENLSSASALCAPQDNFVKRVGRRIALTRALNKVETLKREDRATIWSEYLSQIRL